MKKKISSPRRTAAKAEPQAPPTKLEVATDYPQEGEELARGHYAVRISAPGAGEVQVSINEEEWLPCRESIGHYWFDWAPSAEGFHRVAARARIGKGRWAKAGPRTCRVAGE